MSEKELYKLKFPIGEFEKPDVITDTHITNWITDIETFPTQLHEAIDNLSEEQLDYKYRPEGWTIKQVVHHCADSHINSILRFKLALTEDTPTIRPYFEDRFALLQDYNAPIDSALSILNGVHTKLGILLRKLTKEELQRNFMHPEHQKLFSLEETIGVYAWHSMHHLGHIKQAIEAKGAYK